MTNTIQRLNDIFRHSLTGGKVLLTAGINAKSSDEVALIINKVRTFNDFNENNDPYQEHDFGSFKHNNEKIFFKIDYYNKDLTFGSEDPTNTNITTRVMIIMLASEY